MVNVRERETRVSTYYRGGTRIAAHPGHAQTGDKRWGVFWRKKEKVLPGGTKHHQRRDISEEWHLHDWYSTNAAAEAERRTLMREGKHAVIINVGGRSTYPDANEIKAMLRRHDLDIHRRR